MDDKRKDFALRMIVMQLNFIENVVEEGKIEDIYSCHLILGKVVKTLHYGLSP